MLKYHIQTIELASAQAAISFDNVPQNFTDLVIKISSRSTGSAAGINLRFNNDSSTLYDSRKLFGSGSLVQGITYNTQPAIYLWEQTQSTYTANTFSNIEAYVSNYTAGSHKPVSCDGVSENNATASGQNIIAGVYRSTNPINSVLLIDGGFNFAAGTSVSLYGVKRGSDGRTETASGGVITTSGGYTIHTFNTSGTFVANRDLNVEYLVVGGGGGGERINGGGGAGGYRSSVVGESSGGGTSAEDRLSLGSGTSYLVSVGAGGSGGNGSSTNGTNSVFGSIVSIGGGRGGMYGDPTGGTGALGGSGGGGGFGQTSGTSIGGSGTLAQGFAGGNAAFFSSGGGGGAGSVGLAGFTSGSVGGNGGSGITSSITGTPAGRAGGGGAGSEGSTRGVGVDGGGNGARRNTFLAGSAGTANTGGGGGGGENNATNGYSGGSGVVIIRYLTP